MQSESEPDEWLSHYIEDLLPEELKWATHHKRLSLQEGHVHTLVLLVGYSPEPLFQALCVYKPEHILCIASPTYISLGRDQNDERDLLRGESYVQLFIERYVTRLHRNNMLPKTPSVTVPAGAIINTARANVFTTALSDWEPTIPVQDVQTSQATAGVSTIAAVCLHRSHCLQRIPTVQSITTDLTLRHRAKVGQV